jgi:hypothetical protein
MDQNEEKWKKMSFVIQKTYFLYFFFLATLLALHFKDHL